MSLIMVLSLLSGTAAVFLSLIFGQSVAAKIADVDSFIATIDAYQLIPPATARLAACGLIATELLAIAAILVPQSRPGGASLALMLLIGYAAAMAINLVRGRHDIDCGCGGALQSISYTLVTRNLLLAAIATSLLTVPCRLLAFDEVVLVLVSGITLWLGWTVAEQLHVNSTQLKRRSKG